MRRILLGILIFTSSVTYGQQFPQYTQFAFHQFSFNPAHAGIKSCIDMHTLYRTQWVSFDGAPKSGFFTASIPINVKRKKYLSARHGTGVRFENDRIGQFGMNRLDLAYAAHFNFNQENRLSLGLYMGVIQMGYDPSSTTTQYVDPAVMTQANFVKPDASFGAWYNSSNYYIGLTMPNLILSRWDDIGLESKYRFHVLLNGGYKYPVNKNVTFLPVMMVRIPPSGPLSVDLNVHLDYKGFINFGLGYRNTDALMAFFNIRLFDQLTIGYSFDYTLSDIQRAAKNTHEISLRLTTCKTPKTSTSACPLFE